MLRAGLSERERIDRVAVSFAGGVFLDEESFAYDPAPDQKEEKHEIQAYDEHDKPEDELSYILKQHLCSDGQRDSQQGGGNARRNFAHQQASISTPELLG